MMNLTLNELKLIAKSRGVRGYKNMSKERLWIRRHSINNSLNNFTNARIKKIREDFSKLRHRILKLKIKEIRKSLYKIENRGNLSKSKLKETEQILLN